MLAAWGQHTRAAGQWLLTPVALHAALLSVSAVLMILLRLQKSLCSLKQSNAYIPLS
jgi:hypothetical protein